MTSKKELAKLKPKGTKLIFDDDGNSHAMYELQDEDGFRADGTAEAQRRRFVEEEGRKVREADVQDRVLAKEKRREKKEKRRRREAEEAARDAEAEAEAEAEESDGGVKFLPYEPPEEFEEEERGVKRQRKWFEDDLEEGEKGEKEGKKGKVIEAVDEPETLEDLEMLASGLLG